MARKILIIDDEPDNLMYLRILLEDNDYTVISALDGREGLDLVRKELPDLVCLDIMMPRMTGVTAYKKMKIDPQLKRIPCVIISAYESAYTFKGKAFRRLVPDKTIPEPLRFFEKPIDAQAFVTFVDGVLKKTKKK